MRLVKIRWVGEDPIQVNKRWLYPGYSESRDLKIDPDTAETLIRKHGKENWIVLRDPNGLLGEVVPATSGDGERVTEALKERSTRRKTKELKQ